jgi:hypothetical protein
MNTMLRLMKQFGLALVLVGLAPAANAFSLLGPYDTWQTFTIGYQLAGDIGGPMNLGEEYRWNTPIVTYAFDSSFVNFFGSNGVADVERAITILNNLPAVSKMSNNLTEFPLDTRRFNYQAGALFMGDVKSYALGALVEEMGLASPERFVWTLRSRVVINNIPYYTTIMRNFDPVTWQFTPYVNGTLYTYTIQHTYANPDAWEPVDQVVDPLATAGTAVASMTGIGGGFIDLRALSELLTPGMFFTGLTRDDAGSLRYLLRPDNYNVENLVTNGLNGGTSLFTLAPGSENNPWLPAGATISSLLLTNAAATNTVTLTNNFVVNALRPGVDKVTFVRVDYDSLENTTPTPYLIQYQDRFVSNSVVRSQSVQRVVTVPDIIFSAADLGVDAGGLPFFFVRSDTSNWANNNALNTPPGTLAHAGPGVVQGPVNITFSNIGPWYYTVNDGSGQPNAISGFVWGSFDGTTNPPIAYPRRISIQDLERQVLGGR